MVVALLVLLGAAPPEWTARPPPPAPGLPVEAAPATPASKRVPMPFRKLVVSGADSVVVDAYRVVMAELPDGSVSADVRFASGEPDDHFRIFVSANALAEARAVLMLAQGNEHLAEKDVSKAGPLPFHRTTRVNATTLPFLPSRRLVDESLTGRIGPLRVGSYEKAAELVRDGEVKQKLKVRGKEVVVTGELFKARGLELVMVHQVPGLGAVDLIVRVSSEEYESVVRSIE